MQLKPNTLDLSSFGAVSLLHYLTRKTCRWYDL